MPSGGEPQHSEPVVPAVLPLPYGRGDRRRPGWRRARWVAIGLGLTACVAGSWSLGRVAQSQAQDYLWERQAAGHVEPAGRVLFEPDPARAGVLAESETHRRLEVPGLEHVPEASRPAVGVEPASFARLREAMGEAADSIDGFGALLFLHELSSASGARRIVAIRFLPWVVPPDSPWRPELPAGLVAYVFEPGGPVGQPRFIGRSSAPILLDHRPAAEAASARACLGEASPLLREIFDPYAATRDAGLRWYAGQPDATDPSHFTLAFELHGEPGTIDGFLSADGSAVRMSVRPPEPAEGLSKTAHDPDATAG